VPVIYSVKSVSGGSCRDSGALPGGGMAAGAGDEPSEVSAGAHLEGLRGTAPGSVLGKQKPLRDLPSAM